VPSPRAGGGGAAAQEVNVKHEEFASEVVEWVEAPEEMDRYCKMFATFAISKHGSISAGIAKDVLEKTKLPMPELSKIWQLADGDRDGRLTLGEFVCAMYLASARVRGVPLPSALPAALVRRCAALDQDRASARDLPHVSEDEAEWPVVPPAAAADEGKDEYAEIKPEEKLLFSGIFAELDERREGVIDANTAKSVLERTNLPTSELSQIWLISDVDSDGCLTRGEFVCAMHLASCRNRGMPLPPRLPAGLVRLVAELDGGVLRRQGQATSNSEVEGQHVGGADEEGWRFDPRETQAYCNMFTHLDGGGVGSLDAHDSRRALETTQLPVSDLSTIWQMSDVDCDGRFTRGEFVCAMHLASGRRRGLEFPEELPQDLIDICIAVEEAAAGGALEPGSSSSD